MTDGGKAARTLRVLSTGAPKGGVSGCAAAFGKAHDIGMDVAFVTAPVLRERIDAGKADADVIVCPVAVMDALAAAGHVVSGIRAIVGSVSAGVVVRDGTPPPDLSSAGTLKAAILGAGAVVYNVATSGQYIAQMMDRLGVTAAIADRTIRVPNGAAVMEHLAASDAADEIGFGQLTEISRFTDRGVTLVGPLPAELAKSTTYAAGVSCDAADADGAAAFVHFVGSDAGRRICMEAGLTF